MCAYNIIRRKQYNTVSIATIPKPTVNLLIIDRNLKHPSSSVKSSAGCYLGIFCTSLYQQSQDIDRILYEGVKYQVVLRS